MKNPTVLASGLLGANIEMLKRVVEEGGAGAVTLKSIGPRERSGHRNPSVVACEEGILNAVGLPSPGYKMMGKELSRIKEVDAPVFLSVYGATVREFCEVAKAVARYKPAAIELNLSCPNTEKEGKIFGCSEKLSSQVVSAVKEVVGSIPVMPKLTSQAPDIAKVARACEDAGADAISAINTVPAMLIDIETGRPVLGNEVGGLSGPAIKMIALRCVYEIYKVVNIPILGIGGIKEGKDAIALMNVGASAVGIGSGIHYRGIDVFKKVCQEMITFMERKGHTDVKELVGVSHVRSTGF
jgi:dihydroorotate dehydrogenase (NAD+) catalytic subunit